MFWVKKYVKSDGVRNVVNLVKLIDALNFENADICDRYEISKHRRSGEKWRKIKGNDSSRAPYHQKF